MSNTKKLTFAAICCTLSVVLLYVASLVKTGTLSFQYVCGLIVMIVVWRCGFLYGTITFGVTSLLLFALIPDKTAAISYTLFFGAIPLSKFVSERLSIFWEWVLKIVFINIFIVGLFFIFKAAVTISFPIYYLWVIGIIIGVGYDLLLGFGFSFASNYLKKNLT